MNTETTPVLTFWSAPIFFRAELLRGQGEGLYADFMSSVKNCLLLNHYYLSKSFKRGIVLFTDTEGEKLISQLGLSFGEIVADLDKFGGHKEFNTHLASFSSIDRMAKRRIPFVHVEYYSMLKSGDFSGLPIGITLESVDFLEKSAISARKSWNMVFRHRDFAKAMNSLLGIGPTMKFFKDFGFGPLPIFLSVGFDLVYVSGDWDYAISLFSSLVEICTQIRRGIDEADGKSFIAENLDELRSQDRILSEVFVAEEVMKGNGKFSFYLDRWYSAEVNSPYLNLPKMALDSQKAVLDPMGQYGYGKILMNEIETFGEPCLLTYNRLKELATEGFKPVSVDVSVPAPIILPPPDTTQPTKLPSIIKMAKTATQSAAAWSKSGFKTTTPEQLQARLDICMACPIGAWDKDAFNGTGRCNKCGCSTQAKLRMATERCPDGYWGPVDKPAQPPGQATPQT